MGIVVTKEEFTSRIRPSIKANNKTIALCHGVFDLVHPGHVIHFEQAKEMADILVVSITAAEFVRKGPGRPYFNDEMRLKVLSAIEYIDYVLLSEGYTVDDIVEAVEPDIYVKGEEYESEKDDITGKIKEERELVEAHGGKIQFTRGNVFSSTKIINTAMAGLPEDVRKYMEDFTTRYSMQDIIMYAEKAENKKVLVLGDLIVDQYTYCMVQGLMSKDMGYSAREKNTEEYLGGTAAIARHLSSFSKDVTLMSIIGDEERLRLKIIDELAEKMHLKLFSSSIVPTIIKRRYLTRNEKREEYKKIFAINNIRENVTYEEEVYSKFKEKLIDTIESYDVVFLCDFGHGLINWEIMDIVQQHAKFLVLNCQTNSTNLGLNIITKYRKATVFALDQRELKLAFPEDVNDEKKALIKLSNYLNANGWLTRGAMGAYQIDNKDIIECPAFTLSVKDTIGAGDAFLALAGIFTAVGAPIEIGTFMGNIGGALGANIIGNKESVEKVNALKYASTLLNV